jgi:guanylate cyclase soluble subunit alpha
VAGGLHKPSEMHAELVAWMSLLMLDKSSKNFTPKGDRIKMRVGLHTGDVLAGIVGIKQPRYCLFGNNCTIGNKFESTSEENRVHVSPLTKRFLNKTEGFEFEPRSQEHLPENWFSASYAQPDDITWFLNGYKNENVTSDTADIMEHVQAALKQHNIS